MGLAFTKYSGAGNDFVILNNLDGKVEPTPGFTYAVCNRFSGLGADGLILIEVSSSCDLKMRLFNLDGSLAPMCGNGLRCLKDYAHHHLDVGASCTVEVSERHLKTRGHGQYVSVEMGMPLSCKWAIKSHGLAIDLIDTGAPHAVVFCDSVIDVNVELIGKPLRESFDSNVTFVEVTGESTCRIRTYERGVEGETLACGTGASAAGYAMHHRGHGSPISVTTKSNELLTIELHADGITMTGPTTPISSGVIRRSPFGLTFEYTLIESKLAMA